MTNRAVGQRDMRAGGGVNTIVRRDSGLTQRAKRLRREVAP
jgi:hypothetical protein